MSHKILILCPFPEGVAAGQRLKYEQYFSDWRSNGFEITVSSYADNSLWEVLYKRGYYIKKIAGALRGLFRRFQDVIRATQYDVVYVCMWVTPYGSTTFERLIRRRSKKLIYDIEDNIMIRRDNEINSFSKYLKNPAKIKFLISSANHVITSAPDLNDYCLKLNAFNACTYISSSIDTNRFLPANTYSNDRKIIIGWTGTFSSKNYLELLKNVFISLSKQYEFKLRVIGNFEYDFPEVDLELIQWTKEQEVLDLQGIDIGVYPLEVEDWVSGKSGLKAIQYMAFGIPTVATDVGNTPRVITDGSNGLLVKTEEEWVSALARLIADSSLRRKLGEAARKTAVERFSIQAIGPQYLSILKEQVT